MLRDSLLNTGKSELAATLEQKMVQAMDRVMTGGDLWLDSKEYGETSRGY